MARRLSVRFQHWIVGITWLLVVVLTAAFLFTVFGKFRTMAEEGAQEQFESTAQGVVGVLQAGLTYLSRTVLTEAGAEPGRYVRDGHIVPEVSVPQMLTSVRVHPAVSSQYFGLANGEFLQVTAVREDPALLKALEAPPGTYFAVRTIQAAADGSRTETWKFLDSQTQPLGSRTGPASYAPGTRDWYQDALRTATVVTGDVYRYASTQVLGITVAAPLPDQLGVYGLDVTLDSLHAHIGDLPVSKNGMLALVNASSGQVLAFRGRGLFGGGTVAPLTTFGANGNPEIQTLQALLDQGPGDYKGLSPAGGKNLVYAVRTLRFGQNAGYRVLVAAPLSDFTGLLERARRDMFVVAGLMLLLLLPLALWGTRSLTRSLSNLARESERLKRLDFSTAPTHIDSFVYEVDTLGQAQEVMHQSIRQRTLALEVATAKLEKLVQTGILLGRAQERDALLRHVLFGARDIAHCAVATLFIKTDHQTLRFAMRTLDGALPSFEIPLYDAATGDANTQFAVARAALSGKSLVIDDVYSETRFDMSGTKHFHEGTDLHIVSMLNVPLQPRDGEVVGVLQLLNALDPATGEVVPFDAETVGFIEALAAQSAVAIDNQNLARAQVELMDSMIKILAGAIDAKSAYTGGHCERVPELAFMLAEEASKVDTGPLAGFSFKTEAEWREFRIGAWLHDCGKVTTPEYVVDKATKLEINYNRIHEIRMRFEVLLRDAEIAALQAVAAGQDGGSARAAYAARRQQLRDDFAFVAEANIGGEFMAPDKVERVKAIAGETWWRQFDDRLGLSHEESKRHDGEPAPPLPAPEPLLADKPWHVVPRVADKALDPKYGFQVKVPEHLYNYGEVYNLCIGRGTLSEEERFKINEHIIQTIVMLDNMPFPDNLKRVPEYAGTHHETLIGTGYPRRLTAAQMSIPSRIMAIADIFEALTASDRPYKKAKSLSESIQILSFFKKDQHIDGDLFDLFLRSGAYLRYARQYLQPEQIDEVDLTRYLSPATV
ncbi:MAG: HD domain-containing phosphohydrolase [Pseudomonadota bacterium]